MIAVARGLGRLLPEDARIAVDPFGERFATPWLRFWTSVPFRPLLENLILTVQVRTRLIDEALVDFVAHGGAQVLLLGAGFDARAARFKDELAGVRVFEVDHPATQQEKRARMGESAVSYLPWDFAAQDVGALPDALVNLGHDRSRPTLTVWEGVTMYLSEPVVDASVRAVASLSAPGSPFVFTYLDSAVLSRPGLARRLALRLIARLGEPVTFGFAPDELSGWLGGRGFDMRHDVCLPDAVRVLLPARYHDQLTDRSLRIAFAHAKSAAI
jgi:methyltransferase (TIGR00027 family)